MTATGVERVRGLRAAVAAAAALGALVLVPALASAHLERPSYWPDPGRDTSVAPPAGGGVPDARTLASALNPRARGTTRVVCQGPEARRSTTLLNRSLRQARRTGFRLRPSQPRVRYTQQRAKRVRSLNRRFADRCRFDSIQEAIERSGTNDRVVIMPGLYREPESRSQPVNDPRCADLTVEDTAGRPAPSYEYQVACPHDQNLLYVQGRELGSQPPPSPPRADRHGIPDVGPCLRCNLQLDGSGVKPEDVILDAGTAYPDGKPGAKPGGHAKDVVLRVDRGDGFVGRNFLMRGGLEHGFYTEETDGVLLDRTKFFWNADYGHLSFTTDHHVVKNCHGFGSGDAVVYPGASPETGSQARASFYPDAPRYNTVIRDCDLHHSMLAYSGSMGNSVRITRNHVYGTVAGISTDTISAQGHPGFPADSVKIDNNLIYSNNLNLYGTEPPVEPLVGVLPVGTGIIWAGHNDGRVHDNWIFDNWRRGAMLFAVPDALVEPEGSVNAGISCPSSLWELPELPVEIPELPIDIPLPTPSDPRNLGVSTSCGNRFFDNRMGVAPPGFEMPPGVRAMGNLVGGDGGVLPNGVDFWWDEFPLNSGNCWYENTGPDGTTGSVRPGVGVVPGNAMPSSCDSSVGAGDVVKEAELLNCFLARDADLDLLECNWDETPAQPGSPAAAADTRERRSESREFARSAEGDELRQRLLEIAVGDGDGG